MLPDVCPEIGCYGLAGHAVSPRDLLAEVRRAEELGIGSMFLSERFNAKDAAVLAGAVAAAGDRIGIATAATNHNTRHPLVTATMAVTAHRLSGGRYALGLGRGFDALFDVMGLPRITSAQLEDVAGILRTLWSGGSVVGHDGPAGVYPYLHQDATHDESIPLLMTAIGDRSLDLAGRVADGVVLHSFMTDETLGRCVDRVRRAAAAAGRDPREVRIWSVLVTVADGVDEQVFLRRTVGRMATYLQGYGDVLVRANGWDPAVLQAFRADPLVAGYSGAFDAVGTVDQLTYLREKLIPQQWLAAAAYGGPEQCARRIADQFDAGADSVVLHGAPPEDLAGVLGAWRAVRPAAYDRLPVNPGWAA